MEELNDLILQRHKKLKELRIQGIEAFPNRFEITHTSIQILNEFGKLTAGEQTGKRVKLAGRIMTNRVMGKASFAHLQDSGGKIQIYVKQDKIGTDNYKLYQLLDIGDFIGVEGEVFCTKTGEITILVDQLELLAKALRPLPEKWHGLKDVETRYRQRYLDLVVNDEVRKVFQLRSQIIKVFREFLDGRGFLEVETPMMQTICGGAAARPFTTHHNALDINLYLRIAPELYLKRLIVGGLERIYEINRNFRNEGISTRHNPEFTMLELYQAYSDYKDIMALCQELIIYVVQKVLKTLEIKYQGQTVNLQPEWEKLTLYQALEKYTSTDFSKIDSLEKTKLTAEKLKVEFDPNSSRGKIVSKIFEELVEPKLIQPTFILDYPVELSPLAKTKKDHPFFAERFELFIGGQELANAYSELNDPLEQKKRFQEQFKQREAGDEEAQMFDEDFLRALEHGMPPCGGLGIGIDRLVMVLTDAASIRDVILFPQMRPEGK